MNFMLKNSKKSKRLLDGQTIRDFFPHWRTFSLLLAELKACVTWENDPDEFDPKWRTLSVL